jgi:hypothetical protein
MVDTRTRRGDSFGECRAFQPFQSASTALATMLRWISFDPA